jgi:hypothetical protein
LSIVLMFSFEKISENMRVITVILQRDYSFVAVGAERGI